LANFGYNEDENCFVSRSLPNRAERLVAYIGNVEHISCRAIFPVVRRCTPLFDDAAGLQVSLVEKISDIANTKRALFKSPVTPTTGGPTISLDTQLE
jgi:hypothetical protein